MDGKEEKELKIRILAAAVLLLVVGCAIMEPVEVREEKYGKATPVISKAFASPRLSPGDTWKVYLNASDPDGDMKAIICTMEQPGRGSYPVSRTRIPANQRRDLSGYVYLNTRDSESIENTSLTMALQVQDEAGHYSAPVLLPLFLQFKAKQGTPPPELFQNRDLGPIMIRLDAGLGTAR